MAKIYQPYSEIIDLRSELNEYTKLCDGKSTKFKYYLDWKSNIKNKLSCLDSDEKKMNFKHFLINRKRSCKNINSIFIPIMICCITIVLNAITLVFPDRNDITNYIIFFFIIVILILFTASTAKDHKMNSLRYTFYCDLIDLMEEE